MSQLLKQKHHLSKHYKITRAFQSMRGNLCKTFLKLTVFSSKNPVSSVLCCPKSLSVSKSVSASSRDKIKQI